MGPPTTLILLPFIESLSAAHNATRIAGEDADAAAAFLGVYCEPLPSLDEAERFGACFDRFADAKLGDVSGFFRGCLYFLALCHLVARLPRTTTPPERCERGPLGGVAACGGFLGAVSGGLISDRLGRAGMEAAAACRIPTIWGLIAAGGFTVAAAFVGNVYVAVALMGCGLFAANVSSSCG